MLYEVITKIYPNPVGKDGILYYSLDYGNEIQCETYNSTGRNNFVQHTLYEVIRSATEGTGNLIFKSKTEPKTDSGVINKLTGDEYLLQINGNGEEVTVEYEAI